MTLNPDPVAVLRERLAEERQHAGKGYPEVERRIAAYEAAIAVLSAQGEAVEWQFRQRKALSEGWHDWKRCTKEFHDEVVADLPERYETRALYLAPGGVGDAVTELIAADKEYDAALLDVRAQPADDKDMRRLNAATERRAAALAALASRTGKGEANGR